MLESTWEMVLEPPYPLEIKELKVIVKEGEGLYFPLKRSYFYNLVNRNWNNFIIDMAKRKVTDLKLAIREDNEQLLLSSIKHISSISSMYRFCNASFENKTLFLNIGVTNFKDYIGTSIHALKDKEFREQLMKAGEGDSNNPNLYFANPLSTCSSIVTKDEKVLMCVRSNTVAVYPNKAHVIGGYVRVNMNDENNFSVKDINFNAYMKEELNEELGIKDKHMEYMNFLGISRNKDTRVLAMVYMVKLNIDAKELEEIWKTTKDKYEHKALKFYNFDDLALNFDQYKGKMVPTGEAAITLLLKYYKENKV